MKSESIIVFILAIFAVSVLFAPSLIFNAACFLGFCELKLDVHADYFQFIQVSWLLTFVLVEMIINHFSKIKTTANTK
ncbi:MAG: hypothetical protein C0624_09150 [Desulfuromonas sp.]|nr:MAG: hypothetical protein C0624_09150 [Desulfuromonas sp.]